MDIDLDNLMSSSKPKPATTSSGPSMNQLAQSSTSPAHGTQMTPSPFKTSSVSTGPNYNVNTSNLMGANTPPTSRSTAPGMGMGQMNMGMGVQPGMASGMGMQPGMGMGMNYGGMGMGYGVGPRPMYGGTGFGMQPQMGYGSGMMGAPGMMNPMGMQQQQRQF